MSVSVVIPTFNRGRYVTAAVESALAQTVPAMEVIVVDDGSTDDTRERLAGYGDAIRYVHQENRGVQAARNRGVRLAAGKYVAMLDSDDLWLPEKLARDVESLEAEPRVALVCGRMEVIDDRGGRTGVLKPRQPPGATVDEVLERGSALFSSFTFRREVCEEVGGFDEDLRRFMDLDFTLSVLARHPIAVYAEPRVLYRDHPGNLSKDLWGIWEGRYDLTRKWVRRLDDPEQRRVCRRHLRASSRRLAAGYLKRGRPLRSLRFAAAWLLG